MLAAKSVDFSQHGLCKTGDRHLLCSALFCKPKASFEGKSARSKPEYSMFLLRSVLCHVFRDRIGLLPSLQ